MRYLLDTDTVVDAIRQRHSVAQRLRGVSPDDVAVSAMTVSELHYGSLLSAHSERRLQQTATMLSQIEVLPFNEQTARVHAELRMALRKNAIGPSDLVIAATAVAAARILVTSNIREFSRVPGLEVESWR